MSVLDIAATEVVTDRELALALADDPEVGHTTVDAHMTRDVETIPEDVIEMQSPRMD